MEETVVETSGLHPIWWLLIAVAVGSIGVLIAVKFGKWDWKKAVSKDAFSWIKIIGYGLAILEILVLSENAMERGVSPMAAYGRYTGVALIAIVFGIMLTSAFDQGLEGKYKNDGIVTWWELFIILFPVTVIFICTVVVANTTFMLYLESIGKMEMLVKKVSLIDMLFGVEMESDPENFKYAKGKPVQPETAAYVLTYADVFINLTSILYSIFIDYRNKIYLAHPESPVGKIWYKYKKTDVNLEKAKLIYAEREVEIEKMKAETAVKVAEAKKEIEAIKAKTAKDVPNDKGKSNATNTKFEGSEDDIKYYYNFMKDALGISGDDFEQYLDERCGYDSKTKTRKDFPETLNEVRNGTMDPVVARDKTIKELIAPSVGRLKLLATSFKKVEETLSDKLYPLKATIEGLLKKSPASTEIDDKKKELLKMLDEFKTELKKYAQTWDTTYNHLKNVLKFRHTGLETAKSEGKYKYKTQVTELENVCI